MHIIQVSSELTPIAKVGGLGDVVYGLSKELMRQGHKVQVILPKYDCIDYSLLKNLQVYYRDLWSYDGAYRYHNTVWSAEVENISLLLIEPHHPNYLFSRGLIYGAPDDTDRFLYFSRTAMEFLFKSHSLADILHVHDWPTAIMPVLQKDMYEALGFRPKKTILTIHNLEHQGKCSPGTLTRIGLKGELYLSANKLQDPVDLELINILKGGISYATAVTTVSPSYNEEIKIEEKSHGLGPFINTQAKKLQGILNGVDEDFWNPEIDPYIAQTFPSHPPFNEESWSLVQKGKAANKKELQKTLGLEQKKTPLIACIARLVPQKSPLLIAHAFRHALSKGAQCVILGSTHSEEMTSLFSFLLSECASTFPGQGSISLCYDEKLSHLIYAASDMFLVPSLFEPCGLTQMIALRYGCVPIVRNTGGLADTVFDIDTASCPAKERNGFVFQNPEKKELNHAIDRALKLYKENPTKWNELMQQGLGKDYSWKCATKEYLKLYSR